MEFNIKFDEQMMVKAANRVLDEFEYKGKTVREWADLIANPKTNADRIRAMTDEELADWFSSIAEKAVKHGGKIKSSCWLDWLKQEVAE